MNKTTKIKTWRINIQRRIYRLKRKYDHYREDRREKADAAAQLKTIEEAERLSKEKKCRLWVVRIEPSSYRIYTKGDVKAILRRLGMKGRIDIFSENGTVVHITK